jgi:excisionase family DNA binding protein
MPLVHSFKRRMPLPRLMRSIEPISATPSVCTTSEAARRLGVSNTTVQLMVERGELKAWRTRGGHRRISLDSVQSVERRRGAGALRLRSDERIEILVAEDDAELRELYLKTMLDWDLPINVETAEDGLDALLIIERKRPAILITDLRMARMDGFEFLRKLRAHTEFDSTQVIVVTGLDDETLRQHGPLPPGVAVYRKPVPFEKIHGFVEAQILRRELGLG